MTRRHPPASPPVPSLLSRLRALRAPKLESLFVAAIVLFGFRVGARSIEDNSMFTHIRTGIDMVAGRGIPREDPYSYTASGSRWVVQSWLPEWTYGWAQRLGGSDADGFRLVVLEQALVVALLAWLVVRLARAGSPLRTALAGGTAVGLGAAYWAPRPLLFGLVCMALTITVVERRRTPWLLLPIVWLWVNSHGSFPLGLVWLGARALGEGLDWRAWPRETVRYVGGFAAGLVVSVVNPLGAALLTFPLTLGEKRAAFQNIVEWESPDFQSSSGRFALIFLAVTVFFLLRARLTWRDVVPVSVFFVAILLAMRNIPVAAIVVAPVLGRVLKRPEGSAAEVRARDARARPRLNALLLGAIGVAFLVFGMSIAQADPLRFRIYPAEASEYMRAEGLLDGSHRIIHQDFVGNYLSLRYGRKTKIFIDDRYDMYPLSLSRDYTALVRGQKEAVRVVDRWKADVVLWDNRLPLASILEARPDWREVYRKKDWVVYRRVPPAGPASGSTPAPAPPA